MVTRYFTFSPYSVRATADILLGGGLVALPTETVYGLGANAFDEKACRRVYEVKGRPSDNPMIVHVADAKGIEAVADGLPKTAEKLIDTLMPGPLTLILNKSPSVGHTVTGGLGTVAVRIPRHPVARALLACAGVPVAAPSANLSTKPSATTSFHVLHDFDGKIDAVLEGGYCRVGVESTVLDLTGAPCILREGGTPRAAIEAVIGTLDVAPMRTGEAPKSPGQKYRHYAPDAKVYLIEHGDSAAFSALLEKLTREGQRGTAVTCGIAATGAQSMADSAEYARQLFSVLRGADADGLDFIVAELPESGGLGDAVINRLKKAADKG